MTDGSRAINSQVGPLASETTARRPWRNRLPTIKALRSIKEIAPDEWHGLGCRVIFETHGWLSANESTIAGDPLVTLEYEGAELRSAIAWQVTDATEPSPYYNIESLLARFADGDRPVVQGKTLNCVSVGLHSPILAAPGVVFDVPRLNAHLSAAAAACDSPPAMYGMNFLPRAPALGVLDSLGRLGFQEVSHYQRAVLDIPGNSYDEYLMHLSSRRRWSARRDRRKFAETGQTISFSTGAEAMGEDIVRLQGCNKKKYGQAYDEDETRMRFSELLGFAGEDGLVVRSHLGDICTGFGMFFRMGASLHALCAGFDDPTDAIGPYFECLYHAPIEWACQNGIKEIDYGVGSTMAKSERGCTVIDMPTWYLRV